MRNVRTTETTDVSTLLQNHDVFFIDAYGVLVTSEGALPGAVSLIDRLNLERQSYFIVTNDASRLNERAAQFYQRCGLKIPLERVLTAGLAIEEAFHARALKNPRCAVLGTADTHEYVRRANGTPIEITDSAQFDVVVIGDDSGFETLPTLNALLTSLYRQIEAGSQPFLFLANSDLLYPRGPKAYGFTAGSIARLIEFGLGQLRPDLNLKFEVLGKPGPLLFERGLRAFDEEHPGKPIPRKRMVMIGDQLHTDVQGANQFGIHSCLIGTGLTRWPLTLNANSNPDQIPDFFLPHL